ncbi:PPR domain-containing protein/PPR_2 domain-containing protein [Balamuthia mandrillaris]
MLSRASGKSYQLQPWLSVVCSASFSPLPTRNYHASRYGRSGAKGTHKSESNVPAAGLRKEHTQQLQALARGEGRLGPTLFTTLEDMERAGSRAEERVYMDLLKRCRKERVLKESQRVHAHLLNLASSHRGGLSPHLSVSLMSAYGACGRSDLARAVFEQMKERDVATWTMMIAAETQCGRGKEALQLFQKMQQAGVPPNSFTFSSVIKACAITKDLKTGKHVHEQLIRRGFMGVSESNALISMYGKCGRMEEARAVFQGMKERNVVTWNTIIAEETQCGCGREALELFRQMQQAGEPPDSFTYSVILKACATAGDLETGKHVHAQLLRRGFMKLSEANSLVSMYGKCGKVDDAHAVFQGMKERDVLTWTAMMQAYMKCGQTAKALELFQQMQQTGVPPDSFIYASVLKACTMEEDLETGQHVHAQLLRRGYLNLSESNALISMYGKWMKDRNVVTWNSMIEEETRSGHGREALKLFQQMQQAGVPPNSITYASVLKACTNSADLETGERVHAHLLDSGFLPDVELSTGLINMYGKCGRVKEAYSVFQEMEDPDIVAWNTMMQAYTQCGHGKEALELFQRMQQAGMSPDSFTYPIVLKACTSMADLETGKRVHAQLLRRGFLTAFESSALINLYGKCGMVGDAHAVFQQMAQKDLTSWSTMIAIYGLNGQGREALDTFHEMQKQGVQPDAITFIGLLNACSHAGLVQEGMACFAAMKEKHCIQPTVEHYTCMVDLLGRAGRLDEAEQLIHTMNVPPDAVSWRTLLGACRGQKDIERAQRAAERAIELSPRDASPFVVLSNIFAAAGRWEDVERVRKEMKEHGVKKEPGRSWITVDGQVHSFVVKDHSHPRSNEIYQQLHELSQQIRAAGYKPDMDWVLHDVPDEQKEADLCYHSEKLAIAFGLLSLPAGEPLRIVKNLRVCGDCHTATKFIAKVTKREILVRDANRFHHFSPNGMCSCSDYW